MAEAPSQYDRINARNTSDVESQQPWDVEYTEQRRVVLPGTEEIVEYVADFRNFLKDGTIPERKALIRNFVEGIEVVGDEATLTYTVPMPSDGTTSESASVLDFVKSSPPFRPWRTRFTTP